LLVFEGLGLNLANVISLIGTRGFLALLLFIFGSLLIGLVAAILIPLILLPLARWLEKRGEASLRAEAPVS
jgi:predicted PurR-regulated permease PerM